MDINRNHYFLVGTLLLLLGIQLRLVDSYVLNEPVTRFINTRTGAAANNSPARIFAAVGPTPRKIIRPPQWLGWALMSVGSVLLLHALAMKGPGAP